MGGSGKGGLSKVGNGIPRTEREIFAMPLVTGHGLPRPIEGSAKAADLFHQEVRLGRREAEQFAS
jgi:hypothetical protein